MGLLSGAAAPLCGSLKYCVKKFKRKKCKRRELLIFQQPTELNDAAIILYQHRHLLLLIRWTIAVYFGFQRIGIFQQELFPFCKDTEQVQPLSSRVEETAMLRGAATMWIGDKSQRTSCDSFGNEHAVPLLSQLLMQQGTKQLGRDCVHHICQHCGVCIHHFRGICQLTSRANDKNISVSKAGTCRFYILQLLLHQSGHSLFEFHHVREPFHFLHVERI